MCQGQGGCRIAGANVPVVPANTCTPGPCFKESRFEPSYEWFHTRSFSLTKKRSVEKKFIGSGVLRVIGDTSGLADISAAELDGWASALALRTVQARQIVPTGWGKVANCRYCGPVWSEHELPTLSCGWCWMRAAGKSFPRP